MSSIQFVCIDNDFIIVKDFDGNFKNYLVDLYYKDRKLFFDENISLGDNVFRVYLDFDFYSPRFIIYVAQIVDGDELVVSFVPFSFVSFVVSRGILPRLSDVLRSCNDVYDAVNSVNGSINGLRSEFSGRFSSLNTLVDNCCNSVMDKFDSVNCDVDLTPLQNSIGNIELKIDPLVSKMDDLGAKLSLLQIVELEQKIEEKLGQLFHMPSLNGSNGAKYKDGDEVPVKGYNGLWKVEGSYPMLNADGVTIVVYKLIQDDRVLLAPSVFVGVAEGGE